MEDCIARTCKEDDSGSGCGHLGDGSPLRLLPTSRRSPCCRPGLCAARGAVGCGWRICVVKRIGIIVLICLPSVALRTSFCVCMHVEISACKSIYVYLHLQIFVYLCSFFTLMISNPTPWQQPGKSNHQHLLLGKLTPRKLTSSDESSSMAVSQYTYWSQWPSRARIFETTHDPAWLTPPSCRACPSGRGTWRTTGVLIPLFSEGFPMGPHYSDLGAHNRGPEDLLWIFRV